MDNTSRNRVAKLRITLNSRNVDTLKPAEKTWIAWDDKLTVDQAMRLTQEFLGRVADKHAEALCCLRWIAQTRRAVAHGRRVRFGSTARVRGLTGILSDVIQCCVERSFFPGGVEIFRV